MINRNSLACLAGAVLAFALPMGPSAFAATGSAAAQMLSSDLPAGVSLKHASIDQVADALYTATSQDPKMAMALLKAAIIAKQPPPHHGNIPCPDLIKMLKKTVGAAPDQAKDLLELALSLDPDCADALNQLLADPTLLGLPAGAFGNGLGDGFGSGLGTNFPGSPGFGSAPGGATALPPVVTSGVTPET